MATEKEISYMGYQEMIADISTALEKTSEVMTELELSQQAQQAKNAASRLKSHVFTVGIMGEFKRGKSTVINAMLGEEVAPADVVPASATLNRIRYGLKPKATVVFKDGKQQEVPVSDIAGYVTKISEEAAAMSQKVEQAIVEYPCQFCQNNVEIIDTPGLNDDERMDAISESVIPDLDAVIMVLSAGSPFSKSEAEFVRNKLMTSEVTRMIVLVNRIDTIFGKKDRERVLASIREKIIKEVLDRTAAVHGADSQLYQDTKSKLDDLVVYPLSAIQALHGRMEDDPELVEQSGILKFEERLRKLLTQERGSLEILRVSNVIAKLLAEGESALALRVNTLQMDAEEFEKSKKEAEAKIVQLREEKRTEQEAIRKKGAEIKRQMAGVIEEKYQDLEQRLRTFAENYPITAEDVGKSKADAAKKKEAYIQRLQSDIEKETTAALSDYSEQINVYLQEQLNDECIRVQNYMGSLCENLQAINQGITKDGRYGLATTIGIDAMSNLLAAGFTGLFSAAGFGLLGLGGLIEGYRTNGWKGAATGLLGGFWGGGIASVALIAALGTVPIVPFALITGAAGTLGGKLLTNVVWKKDMEKKRIETLRTQTVEAALESAKYLRDNKVLETWAQQQAEAQVDQIINAMEQEAESMISSTADTLKSIAADLAGEKTQREQKELLYKQLQTKMKEVTDMLAPILNRVNAASQIELNA